MHERVPVNCGSIAQNLSPADVTSPFVARAMPTGGGAEDRDLRAADAESLIAPDDGDD